MVDRVVPFREKLKKWCACWQMRARARAWWNDLDEPLYVVEVQVPATFDLTAIKPRKIPGLLAVNTVDSAGPGQLKLISHWTTKAAHDGSRERFFGKLSQLAGTQIAAAICEGHEQQAVTRPAKFRWFPRTVLGFIGLLGILAGVVGNFETIRDRTLAAALPPDVQISPERDRADVLAGEEFDLSFSIRNVHDWVSCDVAFNRISSDPSEAVSLDTTIPGPFIALKPGATEAVKVHGVTSIVGVNRLTTIRVSLVGQAETWSGRIRKLTASSDQVRPFHLRVWPRRTIGMMNIRDDQQAKRCRVDCQFMIGDEFANGFEIQAQLKDPDDVRFDRIQFPGDPTLNRLPDEQAPKLIQIRWIAKEMKPRKRYQFSLYMKGENVRTSTDWKTALGEMEFVFGSPPSGH